MVTNIPYGYGEMDPGSSLVKTDSDEACPSECACSYDEEGDATDTMILDDAMSSMLLDDEVWNEILSCLFEDVAVGHVLEGKVDEFGLDCKK